MVKPPRIVRRWITIAGVLSGALVLAACGSQMPATTLDPRGDHAQRILDLLTPMLWTALAVFFIVEGALVYTVWKYRRREGQGIPTQVHGNTKIEIAWTIAPAVIVLVITVLTFQTQAANSFQPPDALKVKAVGHQWWYEFQYPDSGIVTASDMYIPKGKAVQVQLEAKDVIHSFWVPKLAGKTDMMPGRTNLLSFTPLETGVYYAQCSVLCGEAHARMAFRVVVLEPDAYERWVQARKTAPVAPTGDAARGQTIFLNAQKQCIGCHAVDGTKAKGIIGPNLTYYGNRTTIAAGTLPYSRENLAAWLRDPTAVKPGNLMGKVIKKGSLSEQDIADLVAYFDSMKLPVELPALALK